MEGKCVARVNDSSGWHTYQCSRNATIERDGKSYCRIHDPEYIKEKRAKQDAKWDAESKVRTEHWAWEAARNKAVEGLTLEELQHLTPAKLRTFIADQR